MASRAWDSVSVVAESFVTSNSEVERGGNEEDAETSRSYLNPPNNLDRPPSHTPTSESKRTSLSPSSFAASHLQLDSRAASTNGLLAPFPPPSVGGSSPTLPAYPPSRRRGLRSRLKRRKRPEGLEEEERTEELDRRVRSGRSKRLLGIDWDILGGTGWTPMRTWPKEKWVLMISILAELVMGVIILTFCLRIWFESVRFSEVILIANHPQLIVATTAAAYCITVGLLGLIGVLLNNRAFLAVYNLSLWIGLALIASVGYLSYKMKVYNLRGKLSEAWSRSYTLTDRLQLQNSFSCCGFTDPYTEAILSQRCFSRTTLPGCLGPFLRYERKTLETFYIVAFTLCAVQIIILTTALLTSNHVTYVFGQGSMPREYRLAIAGKTAKNGSQETSRGSSQS